jgi:hypothetical protein
MKRLFFPACGLLLVLGASSWSYSDIALNDMKEISRFFIDLYHSDASNDENSEEGYKREKFGRGWLDFDGDCQNSRHETLVSQSKISVSFKTSNNCQVVNGEWISPFSNRHLTKASKIDIDHIVPLKWAWDRGAGEWTRFKRLNFANDPKNLLAVEASLNRQKGAKGPSEWLPPKNQCDYIKKFLAVVETYAIKFTEQNTIEKLKKSYCN